MKIIEYEEKYLEDIKDLMLELEEYLTSIDKDELDTVHSDYRKEATKLALNEVKEYKGKCYIAVDNNKVLGLIMGIISKYDKYDYLDYKCPKRGIIKELIVTNKTRSKGIGKLLIDKLEGYFLSRKCEYVLVDVFAYNNIGINFYLKNYYHNRMHTMIKKLEKKDNYSCLVADLNDIKTKCNYEIDNHEDKLIWQQSKINSVDGYNNKSRIMYVGKLNDKIICETTAIINEIGLIGENININGLISKDIAYLCAFRTNKNYENKGYFKRLFNYMEKDLKEKGFKSLVLGVEPSEVKNMLIYFKLGFTNFIKTDQLIYPNKESILVNFYRKDL